MLPELDHIDLPKYIRMNPKTRFTLFGVLIYREIFLVFCKQVLTAEYEQNYSDYDYEEFFYPDLLQHIRHASTELSQAIESAEFEYGDDAEEYKASFEHDLNLYNYIERILVQNRIGLDMVGALRDVLKIKMSNEKEPEYADTGKPSEYDRDFMHKSGIKWHSDKNFLKDLHIKEGKLRLVQFIRSKFL